MRTLLEGDFEAVEVFGAGAGAVGDLVAAGVGADGVGGGVPQLEGLGVDGNHGVDGLSGFHLNALEATEGAAGTIDVGEVADIELDDFGAVAVSDVAHGNLQVKVEGGQLEAVFLLQHLAHDEGGVAEAVAEVEEGIVEVTVGAALHAVVLVVGQLVGGAIEGDGELAAGVDIAEEDVSNGGAAFLTGVPGLEDGVAGLHLGCQGDG